MLWLELEMVGCFEIMNGLFYWFLFVYCWFSKYFFFFFLTKTLIVLVVLKHLLNFEKFLSEKLVIWVNIFVGRICVETSRWVDDSLWFSKGF